MRAAGRRAGFERRGPVLPESGWSRPRLSAVGPRRAARVQPGGAVAGADARWASLGSAAPEAPGPPQPGAASPRPLPYRGRGAAGTVGAAIRAARAAPRGPAAAPLPPGARLRLVLTARPAGRASAQLCADGRAGRARDELRAPLSELKRLRRSDLKGGCLVVFFSIWFCISLGRFYRWKWK